MVERTVVQEVEVIKEVPVPVEKVLRLACEKVFQGQSVSVYRED